MCWKTIEYDQSFNPRICKRCDSGRFTDKFCKTVSIHASVKDATYCRESYYPDCCFNPRICKRCDKGKNLVIP